MNAFTVQKVTATARLPAVDGREVALQEILADLILNVVLGSGHWSALKEFPLTGLMLLGRS